MVRICRPIHLFSIQATRGLWARGIEPRRIDAQTKSLWNTRSPIADITKTEWTILFGEVPAHRKTYDVARETLHRMTEIARSGTTLGEIFDIHAQGLDDGGYGKHRYGATGYSVGCTFSPTSMDVPPMSIFGKCDHVRAGMTLFYHVMIGDSDTGYGMGVGHTLLVTEGAPEVLTGLPDDLTVVR